jgi:hypothetical protein
LALGAGLRVGGGGFGAFFGTGCSAGFCSTGGSGRASISTGWRLGDRVDARKAALAFALQGRGVAELGDAGVEAARLGQPIGVAAGLGFEKLAQGEHGVGAAAGRGLAEARLGGDRIRRAAAFAVSQNLAKSQGRVVARPRRVGPAVVEAAAARCSQPRA